MATRASADIHHSADCRLCCVVALGLGTVGAGKLSICNIRGAVGYGD